MRSEDIASEFIFNKLWKCVKIFKIGLGIAVIKVYFLFFDMNQLKKYSNYPKFKLTTEALSTSSGESPNSLLRITSDVLSKPKSEKQKITSLPTVKKHRLKSMDFATFVFFTTESKSILLRRCFF